MQYKEPYIIEFSKHGGIDIGYITALNTSKDLPFEVKRLFITYYTPDLIVRGRHAHFTTEQILFAVSEKIVVNTESADKKLNSFLLDTPYKGLYIPPNVWHTMQYQKNATQLVLASTEYNESDYLRDYDKFVAHWANK